jgi:carbon-monoxide dehydrogenase iron sulfur subunit
MKEIFVRLDRCMGCRSCEIACAVEHSADKSLFAAVNETPSPRKRLYVEQAGQQRIPMVCRHCEDAPCVLVCRTGAMQQDATTKIVTRDAERCVGCWMCAMVCPYGVIGRHKERRVALKCDRCPDRERPACVDACPTRTLIFEEEERFAEILRADAASRIARGIQASQK